MKKPVFWLGLCLLAGETLGLAVTPDYGWVIAIIIWIMMMIILFIRFCNRIFTGRRSDKIGHKSMWFLVLPVFLFLGYWRLTDVMSDAIKKDVLLEERTAACFCGKVLSVEEKERCFYVYVKVEEDTFLVVIANEDMHKSDLYKGHVIEFYGEIQCFNVPTNQGMFHEWLYYHAKKVDGRIWADRMTLVSDESSFIDRWIWKLKNHMISNCERYLSEDASGVSISMLTGDRERLNERIEELYQRSGIAHILAISGLHISFIGMGLYHTIRRIGGHPIACSILSLAVLLFYGWMTGMSPSTLRAIIMTGLHVLAKGLGYSYDRQTAYGIALIVVLLDSPLMITQPGFMLSFGAVGCLLFSDIFLPKYVKHAKGKVKVKTWMLNKLIPSLSVTLGMLPLTAYHFFCIPLYSMFLNLLVIPLMSVLYPLMLLCGLLGGRGLSYGIEWILLIYDKLCLWSLELPGSTIYCGQPTIWTLLLIYGGMLTLLWAVQRIRLPGLAKKCALFLGCILPVLLLFDYGLSKMNITMLDVGQGDCFLVSLPTGEHIIIDGGSSDVKDVGTYRVIPFLKSQGIHTLDAVFLSHLDEDHISAVIEILEEDEGSIAIKQLIVPVIAKNNDAMDKLSKLLQLTSDRCYVAKAGDALSFSDLKIRVLWPKMSNIPSDSNEGSLVLFMEYQDIGMLFTGDIGMEAEEAVLSTSDTLNCEILKVAHHGSKFSTSIEFLEHLSPKAALISSGRDNTYGHPHKELLERLEKASVQVFNTANLGQVTLYKSQKSIKIVVWKDNDVYNRYKSVLIKN